MSLTTGSAQCRDQTIARPSDEAPTRSAVVESDKDEREAFRLGLDAALSDWRAAYDGKPLVLVLQPISLAPSVTATAAAGTAVPRRASAWDSRLPSLVVRTVRKSRMPYLGTLAWLALGILWS